MAKIVIAFGSFDVLHPGHLHYLEEASKYGNLIVVVARDKTIEKLKGRAPVLDENARLEMVRALRFVHTAVLGEEIKHWNDIYNILNIFSPDYIALGYDQKVDMFYLEKFLEVNGLKSEIVRLKPYKKDVFKSSRLKKGIAKSNL